MTDTNKRVRTTMAVALAGVAAVVGLLAAPAGADSSGYHTSGGARATDDSVASGRCVAIDDSVCSGSGLAVNDSTSSGSAVARDGSVSSGCATAVDDSTASGAPCPEAKKKLAKDKDKAPHGVGGATAARPAAATAGRTLALTGDSTATMAALAALALVVGAAMVVAGARRPAES
jgi:hypothetical protein